MLGLIRGLRAMIARQRPFFPLARVFFTAAQQQHFSSYTSNIEWKAGTGASLPLHLYDLMSSADFLPTGLQRSDRDEQAVNVPQHANI